MARLTFAEVDARLKYDPETGKLFWKARTPDMFPDGHQTAEHNCNAWNRKFAGKEAFTCNDGAGYRISSINSIKQRAHRIAWLLSTGEWPDVIDHINGDPCDNRLVNLRSVTHADNLKNAKRRATNTSGVTGVSWLKEYKKWRVLIAVNKVNLNLGVFDNFEDAVAVRKAAEIEYGYHPNHGRSSA